MLQPLMNFALHAIRINPTSCSKHYLTNVQEDRNIEMLQKLLVPLLHNELLGLGMGAEQSKTGYSLVHAAAAEKDLSWQGTSICLGSAAGSWSVAC